MKLRSHLMLLVLAALVPVLLFAGTMVGLFAAEQRRQTERGLQETARALAMAVDRELASAVATLETLATSHHVDAGSLEAFRTHALRVVATRREWAGITLLDAAGQLVLTTKPPTGAGHSFAERPYFQRVIETALPAISGYLRGRLTGEPTFAVAVPVFVGGHLRYVLSAAVTPQALSTLLAGQRLSAEWVGAVMDADGVVLARTRTPDRFVGRPATPSYLARTLDRREDVFRAATLDGTDAYGSFSRVEASGWTVAIAVPASLVDGPLRASVVTVMGGGLLLLAFGLGIALVFGRRIARPLGALASSAPALARGEPLAPVDATVTEVRDLALALEAASAERRAAERALGASEQRLRRIIEGQVMGVAFADSDGRVRDANAAFLALTGYERGDLATGRVSWHGMTPAEHAAADARAADEMRREGFCRPYEKEVLRRDGARIPVMVSATPVEPGGAAVVLFVHDLTELRWAQQERERLFALLTALLESAPVGYAVLDQDLRYVAVNEVLARVNGLSPARHVGRSLRDVVPELAGALEPLHRQVLQTGIPILNVEGISAPAAWWRCRHYLRSFYPIRDDAGAILGVGVAVVDITERKRAERQLEAQHAVTRILAEGESLEAAALPLIDALCLALDCEVGEIWHIDGEGHARCVEALAISPEADDFAAAARGLTLEREVGLAGRAWREGKCVWVRDLAAEAGVARAEAALAAGLRSAVAFPLLHGDVVGIASFFCRRAWEPDADVLDMLASVGSQVGQFVERRRAERERAELLELTAQALRDVEASERRYRQLVEALPHVAWTAGPGGALHYLNRHWFDYTGLTAAQTEGEWWRSAMHPDDVESTLARWRQAVATGEGYDMEHRLRRRDGFYRWFLGRVAPVRDSSGTVAMWLGVAVDIDAQKRAELGAVDASRAKDNFLATLSHELRTPLGAMYGWLRLLRDGRLDGAGRERALDTIERNVRLQTQMIEDLLDVSRIVAGKFDLHVVPVDLGGLVEQAVDAARPGAEAKGLTLDLAIDDGARRSAGDPERLLQALGNLLANAVKFTDHGGRIAVRLERRGARGRISVRDTGHGIAAALLPYVFDRFRQGGAHDQRGLGLGLAIVKQIVELHGGSVYAESAGEGRGATFVVQLALAEE